MVVVAFPPPPASGCHQPPDATSLWMPPVSGNCHQLLETDHHSFRVMPVSLLKKSGGACCLATKTKNKNPTWWQRGMVIRMLPGEKNENSQPSHGSGGIPATTSLRMPPASGCHQLLETATSFRKWTSTTASG